MGLGLPENIGADIMKHSRCSLIALFLLVGLAPSGFAQAFKVLHSFTGFDGSHPEARMLQGVDGNFYGTAAFGGLPGLCPDLFGCGVIFKLDAAGNYTALHLMSEEEGGMLKGLVQAPDGFLYGIAERYGSGPPKGCGFTNACGTLFRIDTAGNFTVLHNFGTTDPATPTGGLLLGRDGFLYGTTLYSIYRADFAGNVTTLHNFDFSSEGGWLNGPLVEDEQGNLYGTAYAGGFGGCPELDDTCGTVFKMNPAGNVTVLHFFAFGSEYNPAGELVRGADGALYGTTEQGVGLSFGGAAFKVDLADNYSVIHIFNTAGYGPEGMKSEAGLLSASHGKLFGTNSLNGLPVGSPDVKGTVYRMNTKGKVAVLHTFTGPDGATPFAGLTEASDGRLYGTTFGGGANDKGTIFRLNPRTQPIIASFSFSPNPVPQGGTTTGTVTLSAPAPRGGRRVDLSNTNAGLVTVPDSLIVPEGKTQATFQGVASQFFTGSVKLWASARNGAGPAVTLKVKF